MSAFSGLNSAMGSLTSATNLGSLLTSTFDVQSKLSAALSSKLGAEVNKVLGGFQSITQELDAVGDFVSGSGIAMLVENPPGLDILKKASSLNSGLEAITESTMGGGFLNVAITANTPEAIAKSLSAITNLPATAMAEVLKEISPAIDSITSQIDGVLGQITKGLTPFDGIVGEIAAFEQKISSQLTAGLSGALSNVSAGVSQLTSGVTDALGNISAGVSQLVSAQLTSGVTDALGNISADVTQLVSSQISSGITEALGNVSAEVTQLVSSQISSGVTDALGNISAGVSQISSGVTDALGNISAGVSQLVSAQISSKLSSALSNVATNFQASLPPLLSNVTDIGSNAPVSDFTRDVTTVNSSTHIQSILIGASREFTTVVVGCSNTFKDQDVRASNVPGWHFLITRAGELQEVTNVNTVGNYAMNYNTNTVGVIFAGGLNITLKEAAGQDKSLFVSAKGITREQYNAFDKFMEMFYATHPYGQAIGIQDIPTPANVSGSRFPGFDVGAYCKQRFGKDTVLDTSKPAPTLKELELQMSQNSQGVSDPGINDEPNESTVGPR